MVRWFARYVRPRAGKSDDEFREIYAQHFNYVWHTLRRLSVAEADLMDAVQNVFLTVHRKLPEFEGRAQIQTWLFQICRRVASDHRRAAPARREVVTDAVEVSEVADFAALRANGETGGVFEQAESAQRVRVARELLDQLPEAQREVFIMYELEQLSGEEISRRLGVPVGTVRSRIRLARSAFRGMVLQMEGSGQEETG